MRLTILQIRTYSVLWRKYFGSPFSLIEAKWAMKKTEQITGKIVNNLVRLGIMENYVYSTDSKVRQFRIIKREEDIIKIIAEDCAENGILRSRMGRNDDSV